MEFAILGPFKVVHNGMQLNLGGHKQRALLAVLACNANQVLSVDRLVEELWNGRSPRTAVQNLRVYVYQLRRILGSGKRIIWRPPGYALIIDTGELDIETFADLAAQGERALSADSADQAAEYLRAALGVWRGPALADLRRVESLHLKAIWLEERRLAVIESRTAAELMLGLYASVADELLSLVAEYPLRENIRAQLMLALYRLGRRAEALAAYREGRTVLVEELGVEPGLRLQRLHKAILSDDEFPAGTVPPAVSSDVPEAHVHGPAVGEFRQIRTMLMQISRRLDRLEASMGRDQQ